MDTIFAMTMNNVELAGDKPINGLNPTDKQQ